MANRRVESEVTGNVWKVVVNVGDQVAEGDVLIMRSRVGLLHLERHRLEASGQQHHRTGDECDTSPDAHGFTDHTCHVRPPCEGVRR